MQFVIGGAMTSIDPGTHMGPVSLRVGDLDRSLEFYEGVLGLERLGNDGAVAVLGAMDGVHLLRLLPVPGARPMPRTAAGLYHFAILVPTRPDLGRALRRLAESGVEIGQADHLVSEALYLSDPDQNGIEIYRDRPRDQWRWANGRVQMAVDPLNLREILAEGDRDPRPAAGLPAGTRMGHVHLQVSDTGQAANFYNGLLGFDLTAQMPGAVFASAGGYHHHLGLNSWSSRGGAPAPAGSAGLESFVIQVPSAAERDRLEARLSAVGYPTSQAEGLLSVRDPWNVEVLVSPAAQA
jgi:catechol 2,3-dioxygenase